jgi:hypothetical protein
LALRARSCLSGKGLVNACRAARESSLLQAAGVLPDAEQNIGPAGAVLPFRHKLGRRLRRASCQMRSRTSALRARSCLPGRSLVAACRAARESSFLQAAGVLPDAGQNIGPAGAVLPFRQRLGRRLSHGTRKLVPASCGRLADEGQNIGPAGAVLPFRQRLGRRLSRGARKLVAASSGRLARRGAEHRPCGRGPAFQANAWSTLVAPARKVVAACCGHFARPGAEHRPCRQGCGKAPGSSGQLWPPPARLRKGPGKLRAAPATAGKAAERLREAPGSPGHRRQGCGKASGGSGQP